jgi:hypothetical protein
MGFAKLLAIDVLGLIERNSGESKAASGINPLF